MPFNDQYKHLSSTLSIKIVFIIARFRIVPTMINYFVCQSWYYTSNKFVTFSISSFYRILITSLIFFVKKRMAYVHIHIDATWKQLEKTNQINWDSYCFEMLEIGKLIFHPHTTLKVFRVIKLWWYALYFISRYHIYVYVALG